MFPFDFTGMKEIKSLLSVYRCERDQITTQCCTSQYQRQ